MEDLGKLKKLMNLQDWKTAMVLKIQKILKRGHLSVLMVLTVQEDLKDLWHLK